MNHKTPTYIGFIGIFLTSLVAFASHAANEDFDFTKINGAISESLATILGDYPQITAFQYTFDEEGTNVEHDHYKINLHGQLAQAPWTKGPVVVDSSLALQVRPNKQAGIEIQIQKSITTDALALIRFLVQTCLKCPPSESTQGAMRVLMMQNCKDASQLSAATTLADLQSAVAAHIEGGKQALHNYLVALETAGRSVEDETLKSLILSQMDKTRSFLQSAETFQLSPIKEGFKLTMQKMKFHELLTLKNIQLEITPKQLNVALTVKTPLGEKLYDAAKPEMVKLFRALENQEDYAKELVKIDARVWLNLISQHLSVANKS